MSQVGAEHGLISHHDDYNDDDKDAFEHCDVNDSDDSNNDDGDDYSDDDVDGDEKPVNFFLWQSFKLKLFFLFHHVR